METAESNDGREAARQMQAQIQQYWAGDLSRRVYRLRTQRKAILENCRRIAVAGVNPDPESASFVALERLLGMGLEMIPILPNRESLLGLRCFARVRDVPGKIDVVQVHPADDVELMPLARDAVEKAVDTFWIEIGLLASPEVIEVLSNGKIRLIEYESLESEYLKHTPPASLALKKDRKAVKVHERMTKNPVTVTAGEALKDALGKMDKGKFRHLPVVDESGKLIAVLSDRDIRLIRPSLAFVNKEDAAIQLWSIAVQQAAVFDPVRVNGDTPLKEAANLMLRWQVGGLPVVDKQERVIGIITYTDILREFIGLQEPQVTRAHRA